MGLSVRVVIVIFLLLFGQQSCFAALSQKAVDYFKNLDSQIYNPQGTKRYVYLGNIGYDVGFLWQRCAYYFDYYDYRFGVYTKTDTVYVNYYPKDDYFSKMFLYRGVPNFNNLCPNPFLPLDCIPSNLLNPDDMVCEENATGGDYQHDGKNHEYGDF